MTAGTLRREKSELLDIFTYPAGETQVRLTEAGVKFVQRCNRLNVIVDIHSAQSLVETLLLADAIDAVDEKHTTDTYLYVPYLPYSRADRRFTVGDCFGLGVLTELLIRRYSAVYTLDVHSDMAQKMGVDNVSALPLIKQSIVDFARRNNTKSVTVLFPDKGAQERYTLNGYISCNTDQVEVQSLNCSKVRNPVTGKFERFDVPRREEFYSNTVLIVDDICDGGGTFCGIANAVSSYGLTLGLYVTHGIFSKGFAELTNNFQHIYTTNSFPVKGSSQWMTAYDAVALMMEAK